MLRCTFVVLHDVCVAMYDDGHRPPACAGLQTQFNAFELLMYTQFKSLCELNTLLDVRNPLYV